MKIRTELLYAGRIIFSFELSLLLALSKHMLNSRTIYGESKARAFILHRYPLAITDQKQNKLDMGPIMP